MRLWTIHPRYLDTRGLVALWREGLLARAVLRGRTRGYRQHPQLARFRTHDHPVAAINAYLIHVYEEAARRGFEFDRRRIGPVRECARLAANRGQIAYEWQHLMRKLQQRDPERYRLLLAQASAPAPHPLFRVVRGEVEDWERV
jgi:hypothetical protein